MKLSLNFSAKFRKIIAIISIVCVSVAAFIGILAILGVKFGDWMGFVLLTLLDFFVVSLFCLNCIEAINRRNIFGYLSALFLLITGFLFLIQIWGSFISSTAFPVDGWFLKTIVVLAAIAIEFSVIISRAIILRKNLMPVQIISYAGFGIILIRIVLLILGADAWLKDTLTVFIIIGIVTVVLFIVLSIRSKLIGKESDDADLMSISTQEYADANDQIKALKARVSELEKENAELKKALDELNNSQAE